MSDPTQLQDWRAQYLNGLNSWSETTSQVQQTFRQIITTGWDRARYVARLNPLDPAQMVVCPPTSLLNMAPNQQHRGDYATGIFEGSSAEPTVDGNGKITGVNVVLQEPRLKRFRRSMQARNFDLPVPLEQFGQAILDITALHGLDVVTADDGSATRAYIRPAAGPGVGKWGVAHSAGHRVEASTIIFRWGHYLPDVDRVYSGSGARCAITGVQRMFAVRGKHASNYGNAAFDGNVAHQLHYDELVYLAPYGIRDGEVVYGLSDFDDLIRDGVLADGPGEEIFGILSDGETLVYPPMRVNRLGGTVLQYLIDHLAPALGLKTLEADITLADLRAGKVVGLAYAGNAARVAPIGQLDIVKPGVDGTGEVVETVVQFGIHPAIAAIRDQWENELRGRKPASHASLLTPVDLEWGREFRSMLDSFWQKFGF